MNSLLLGLIAAWAVAVAATVQDSGWISGDTLTTLISILAGAGGIVGGKMWSDRSAKKHEDEIRAQIANELRAKITNDPLHVQNVNDCISVKECNRRMKDLDDRVTRLEQKVDDGFEKIEDKLEAMDCKSEQRSVSLHSRLDKIFERMAK